MVVEAGQGQVLLQEGAEGVGGGLEKIEARVKQQVVTTSYQFISINFFLLSCKVFNSLCRIYLIFLSQSSSQS